MKKFFLFLALSAAVISCNKLADNEYEITGSIEGSDFDGKKVVLEKQGAMGFEPVDTVVVENGKFTFKGTTEEPSLHFLSFETKPMEKANFILENGSINIKVNKDSIYRSVQSGTFNNDKLNEYYDKTKANTAKVMKFQQDNTPVMMEARKTNDTVAMNRLNKEYKNLMADVEKTNKQFVKDNPKAYINIFIIRQLMSSADADQAEIKELYNSLDESVKNTKDGKELGDTFKQIEEQEKAKENVGVGKKAPDFSAATPDGKMMSLKDAMGRVTIIDFWASWCKPCRMENPNVVAMYNELHGQGLNIIGVSLDKEADAWKKAIADDKLTWNHVSNLKFWEDPIAKQYGVQSIPATFVLDAEGNIVAKDLRGDQLKAKVKELLAK
ncbi:redoxin domain-containing protein [Flavobacterium sp. D11R37]|uniref:TlpA disulfide reductase family protein n=1 Tax=Flavobacterium coralii TaxID=2838017 RepID=UPI001CA74CF5|nr:TlpA disulfide reductase family protein [Flavobacterium coralii]MBY8961460.1 redoxin domain-containing protein [Flavobacterium coralii]